MMKTPPLIIALLSLTGVLVAADPVIISAEELGKKWKRTKSITAPVEKLRKGLTVETSALTAQTVEVKVDADTEERFQNIQFALDSDRLEGAATFAQLTEIAKAMQMAGMERFLIEGHTCDLGDEGHNLGLSQKRALAVKAYLAGQGVAPERLQIIGFGPQDPLVANTSEPARQQNRRVQIFRKL